tara:strand:+ start:2550 stop:3407 length:858 start_codon:yes stop_codon:yes gene_type:complete
MDNKLQNLLYRKEMTFKLMGIWSKGIRMYSDYIYECKKRLDKLDKESSSDQLLLLETQKNIHEADIPLKHYITSFKQARTEYDNYIIPEIEKSTSKEEKETIEFKDSQKIADEMSNIEIYGSHSKQPDNVELINVNEDIKQHISLLENMIKEIVDKLPSTTDSYLLAKYKLDLFQYNLKLITNTKRLKEREDYYYNSFKPVYDSDMIEAAEYLAPMLERAKDIIKLGVDVKLGFLLEEYEKNKGDKEKVWLFYTALKSRLRKITKEMRRNKGKFKGKMHLSKDII